MKRSITGAPNKKINICIELPLYFTSHSKELVFLISLFYITQINGLGVIVTNGQKARLLSISVQEKS
jgi:hypothetical protein